MSKGLGQKIAIKFTEVLSDDVTGLVPTPLAPGDYFRPVGVATGSSQYSSYAPSNAFDGSTSSRWYTRTSGDQWIQIELAEPTWVYGFRWYVSSYRPNGFDFQGSNDGEIWEDILTNNSPNATGWHEFPTDSPKQYKYYRWTVTSRHSSYLYVYEIELLGVVGNERAFTITGKEYQYVNGPLIDRNYQVDKVERYPIQREWELGEELHLDVDFEEKEYGLNEGELRSASSTASYEMGWEFKVGNENIVLDGLRINPKTAGNRTVKLRDSSGTILRSVQISCEAEQWVEGEIEEIELQANTSYIISADFNGGNYRADSLDRGATFHQKIEFSHSRFTDTLNSNPSYIPANEAIIYGVVDIIIKGQQHYIPSKIHTPQAIALSGDYRVRWLEDKPTDTNIAVEYTTGETQGQWQEIGNGEVINVDTNLWLKITLSTEDETITPTLEDLWLEEPDAPQDTILLTMNEFSRFNNVEGPLTVQYDQTVGSLRGRGGPVEGFTETFTPTDLEPKPNPHVAENIEVSAEANVALTKVTYNQGYADEQIIVSATATVDFVYVGIINP